MASRELLEENIDHLIIFLQPKLKKTTKKQIHRGKSNRPVETRSLRLAVWKVSGKVCKCGEYQAMMPNLCRIQGKKAEELIPNWPVVSGLVWVNYTVNFLFETFDNGYSIEP